MAPHRVGAAQRGAGRILEGDLGPRHAEQPAPGRAPVGRERLLLRLGLRLIFAPHLKCVPYV